MSEPLRHLVITGGGSAGWMTAAACARFLGRGWRITLVESDAIGTIGVGEATIPQIRLFNAALGLDEDEFLRATKATIKLGIEFVGWTRDGERYMHAFGRVGRGRGLIDFHHYWLRAHAAGRAPPLGAYALNEVAARAGKFTRRPLQTGEAPTSLAYAFHFDAGLYAAYLRAYAEARGVERVEGRIVSVDRDGEGGDIAGLTLDDGRAIAGDFFIDCSGFAALLLGKTLGTGFEDWSRWLPCDRAVTVGCAPGDGVPNPYTSATAHKAGWQWRIPLQHRIGNGHVYASAHLSDDEAVATLLAHLDGAPAGDPRMLRFTAGKRRDFWVRNCVAVGLASGFLEPLESTSLHLVQTAIGRLMNLLPAGNDDARRAEYNRLTHSEYDRIRDFLVLHYHANQRTGEPLWDACRGMALPDELSRKLALFRESGVVSRIDEELFAEPGWVQVLIGQGVIPRRHHPLADQPSDAELDQFLAAIDAQARAAVAPLPSHADFIAGLYPAPSRSVSA